MKSKTRREHAKAKRAPKKKRVPGVHPEYVRVLNRVVDAFAPALTPTASGYLAAASILIDEASALERRAPPCPS